MVSANLQSCHPQCLFLSVGSLMHESASTAERERESKRRGGLFRTASPSLQHRRAGGRPSCHACVRPQSRWVHGPVKKTGCQFDVLSIPKFRLQRAEGRSEVQTRPGETRPDETRQKPFARPVRQARAGDRGTTDYLRYFFGESERPLDGEIATLFKRPEAESAPALAWLYLCLMLSKRDISSTAQKQLIAGHVKLATDHSASVIESIDM